MKLDAQRSAERWQDMPVTGEFHAQTAELGFISLYAPEVDRVAGKLAADLAVSGTLGTPLIDGNLKLSDAELDLYQVNLALRGAQLEARLLRNGLDFQGSARIGAGTLNAGGRLEWRDAQPYGKFKLEGQNLRVVDVPEAAIDASPNLDFKIDGRRIEVTGAVKVPFASIVPADLTNAVRASSDEVLVGQEVADPSKRFEVFTGISLTLGDKVSLDTFGLTARLTGTITLRSGGDDITRGAGELSMEDGKYTAYGRRLDIERGPARVQRRAGEQPRRGYSRGQAVSGCEGGRERARHAAAAAAVVLLRAVAAAVADRVADSRGRLARVGAEPEQSQPGRQRGAGSGQRHPGAAARVTRGHRRCEPGIESRERDFAGARANTSRRACT